MLLLPPFNAFDRPAPPYRVNHTNPVTSRIRHFWPLVAGTGLHDILTGRSLTINASSGYTWQPHPTLGVSLYLPSGGATASMLLSGLSDLTAPWTFHFMWHRIDGPASVHVVTSHSANAAGVRGEQFNNTNNLGLTYGGTDGSFGLPASTTRAVPITIVQLASGNATLYLDMFGASRGTASLASSGVALPLSHLGNYTLAASLPIYGWWGHAIAWERTLNEAEVLTLHNPLTMWDVYALDPSLWWVKAAAGGGGTGFTLDLGGAVTPAGAAVHAALLAKAGAATSAGAIVRAAAIAKAGALTPAGVSVRLAQQALAGAVTPAGAIEAVRVLLRTYGGTVTSAGVLAAAAAKTLSGAVTPAGAPAKAVTTALAGSMASAGAVATVKVLLRSFAGSLASSGAIVCAASIARGGSLAPAGALAKAAARSLAGSLDASGAVAAVRLYLRTLTGAVAGSGAVTRTTLAVRTGALSAAGALSRSTALQLAGAIASAGAAALFVPGGATALWVTATGDALRGLQTGDALTTLIDGDALRPLVE